MEEPLKIMNINPLLIKSSEKLNYLLNSDPDFIVSDITKDIENKLLLYVMSSNYPLEPAIFSIIEIIDKYSFNKSKLEIHYIICGTHKEELDRFNILSNVKFTLFDVKDKRLWIGIAVKNSHYECLKYLLNSEYRKISINTYDFIGSTSVECFKYLIENKCFPNDYYFNRFIGKYGTIEYLDYLIEHGLKINGHIFDSYAELGQLDCLKYLFEKGYTYNNGLIERNIVKNGHLDCLKIIHEHGGKLCGYLRETAGEFGQLDILAYLIEHGKIPVVYPKTIFNESYFFDNTCKLAAKNGHLDCLIYAHTHGIPWNYETPYSAERYGHLDCLKYALENGCEYKCLTYYNSCYDYTLECIKYLHENGYKIHNSIIKYSAIHNKIDCLEYLFENGYKFYNFNLPYSEFVQWSLFPFTYVHNFSKTKDYIINKIKYRFNSDYSDIKDETCLNFVKKNNTITKNIKTTGKNLLKTLKII